MPGHDHELIPKAIDDDPAFAARMLRLVGVDVPPSDVIEVKPADLSVAQPLELRADRLVLALPLSRKPELACVVEVQLNQDPDKEYAWPAYAAEAHRRHRCEAVVLVICLDVATEAWVLSLLDKSPRWMHAVRVLGPSRIPRIVDPHAVAEDPWMAVLSALAHRRTQEDASILRAVQEGLPTSVLPSEVIDYAWRVIEGGIGGAAARALEAMMQLPEGYKAPQAKMNRAWYEKGIEEGIEKGIEKGAEKGRAEVYRLFLRRLIARRAIALTPDEQARIDSCDDMKQLDQWQARAETATAAAEIFGPNE